MEKQYLKSSKVLREKLKEFEGFKLKAYLCPAGVPTIGAGHTRGVKMGMTITPEQGEQLLTGDLLPVEKYINSMPIELTQGQFDALVDFCFNFGTANFMKSTLRKRVLSHASYEDIKKAFMMWVRARVNGKFQTLPGLVKRREWEAKRWLE